MTRSKLQKILNKLDGKHEATAKVIADFDVSVKALRDKLEHDITVATLDEVNAKIKKLRQLINFEPLFASVEGLRAEFKQNALATLKELESKTSEWADKITPLTLDTETLKKGLAELKLSNLETSKKTAETIKSITDKIPVFAIAKEVKESIEDLKEDKEKIIEESKDYTDKTRMELLNLLAQRGGGNANRNIAIGGNNSVLQKYTDINLKPGSNVTITYANNETTKQVDITLSSSGGGGSVGGTVRQIQTLSVSSTVGTLSGTDQVYLCSQGIQIVLPTPVSDTNLYTIKNVSNSSILIVGTIDDDASGIIMPVKYTSVDIISNNTDWNIT